MVEKKSPRPGRGFVETIASTVLILRFVESRVWWLCFYCADYLVSYVKLSHYSYEFRVERGDKKNTADLFTSLKNQTGTLASE